ncbi:stage V sporulation protein AE [Bacillaceae bacterium SIJ1]|uniref:stage V sporulation protein AE n=1 Tax=Litoribacterium kuwaitense TaxID=1398745 RepID=UPI0013EBE2B8|nr:stage V sporulation protein AE [Litoribacterium kuwaitense]NGP43652.1 stage V sporulation protein AE [Litoribacterium kuwaitense]
MKPTFTIFVTDGDEYAEKNVHYAARKYGAACISVSSGNPTMMTGKELLQVMAQTEERLQFIMFDDCGLAGEGPGEQAMLEIAAHQDVRVLGVIAVASKTRRGDGEWASVDVSVDRYGKLTHHAIDKSGLPDIEVGRVYGDTVDCLEKLRPATIVGIGDIGKMDGRDTVERGAPITCQAIELILERSGFQDDR